MFATATLLTILTVAQMEPNPVRKIIRDFPHPVDSVAFAPDGKVLATATRATQQGRDALRLWDVASGKEICQLGDNYRFGCGSVAFTRDGKTLVSSCGPDGTVWLWNTATRKVRLTLKGNGGFGRLLALSPDSGTIALTGDDPTVRLYDLQSGKLRLMLEGNVEAIAIAFSPDGRMLAASSNDGTVALWSVVSGKSLGRFSKHTQAVNCVAFAPDSKTLYSVGQDRLLVSWDTTTCKERKTVELKKGATERYVAVRHAALSPDGQLLGIMGQNVVRVFDMKTERFLAGTEWDYQDGGQHCITFSPDGKFIATGAGSSLATNSVYLYDVPRK